MWVNGFGDQVSQVLQIECGQVAGFVTDTQGPKSPIHVLHLFKPTSLWQKITFCDPVGKGGVFVLQKIQHRADGLQVLRTNSKDAKGII